MTASGRCSWQPIEAINFFYYRLYFKQGLIYKFRAASDIGKKAHFFEKKKKKKKKGPKNSPTPNSIPFVSVSHQNKALHSFQKRGQHPIFGCIKKSVKNFKSPIWLSPPPGLSENLNSSKA